MNLRIRKTLLGTAFALLTVGASAATNIDTSGAYSLSFFPLANDGNSDTYGQTFTVGADNLLNSFTLYLEDASNTLSFRAQVFKWAGGTTVGAALYSSAVQQFSIQGTGTPTGFMFDTGSLSLIGGQQYMALLSTAGLPGGQWSGAAMPSSGGYDTTTDTFIDTYSGGDFFYRGTSSGNSSWSVGGEGDVWFKAALSSPIAPVPEPETYAMLLAGLGIVSTIARRRKIAAG